MESVCKWERIKRGPVDENIHPLNLAQLCIAPSFVPSYGFNTIQDITHVVVNQLLLNLSAVGLLHLPQAQLQHNRGRSEESILAEDVAVNKRLKMPLGPADFLLLLYLNVMATGLFRLRPLLIYLFVIC